MRWLWAVPFLAACSAADATTSSVAPADPDGDDVAGDGGSGTPPEGNADGGSDKASTDAPVRFKIQIDYRFDSAGYFADPVRKKALEGACRIWGRVLASSFENVPANTFVLTRNPEQPNVAGSGLAIEYEIDDLLIFVGSAELPLGTTGKSSPTAGLSGVTDAALASKLQQRFDQKPFQPWTGWISFDATTDFHFDPAPEAGNPVPAGKMDFVSVALHEIGHVLGFGTADAFDANVSGGAFRGAKTMALFGGPLALEGDLAHVPITTLSGGKRLLMDLSDATGARSLPTPLDKAVFEDLGYAF